MNRILFIITFLVCSILGFGQTNDSTTVGGGGFCYTEIHPDSLTQLQDQSLRECKYVFDTLRNITYHYRGDSVLGNRWYKAFHTPEDMDSILALYVLRTELFDTISVYRLKEPSIVTVTDTTTIDSTYYTVLCDASSNDILINLPTASSYQGQYNIKLIANGGTNEVVIDANGTEEIDGNLTQTISTVNTSISIVSDGSNWYII